MSASVARPVMIYHVPYPLNRQATSGSGIRPVRMRDAFEAIGYEVWEVSGTSGERSRRIRDLKRRVRAGATPQFVYSESSTMPTPLTDPHHLPLHPWLDLGFLRWCRRHGIPTGVFYRDIYWQFPEYRATVPGIIAFGTRMLYRRDLRQYRTSVDRIFLPSMRMAEYLPAGNRPQAAALPPGAATVDAPHLHAPGADVSLLFVGGLGDFYRMHETVRAVAMSHAHMTLCTKADQYEQYRHEYEPLLGGKTTVVHKNGPELEPLFRAADIGVLMLEPVEYREFAAPLKLYEYIGYGKPILATEGTLVGDFVEQHGIGWVLPYDAAAIAALLDSLAAEPEQLAEAEARVRAIRDEHTWEARARQAAEMLGFEAPSHGQA